MENYRGSETRTEVVREGWQGKVDEVKSRSTELIHRMQHVVSERSHGMKQMAIERSARVKPMIHDAMGKADRELHSNPAKWAGIAAGASFILGMIGRELRHRRAHRRALPDLIIIETT